MTGVVIPRRSMPATALTLVVALLATLFPLAMLTDPVPANAEVREVCRKTGNGFGGAQVTCTVEWTERGPTDDPSGGSRTGRACLKDVGDSQIEIPCRVDGAVWVPSRGCYVEPLRPQPGRDSPAWEGRTYGEGAFYQCAGGDRAVDGVLPRRAVWFLPEPPPPAPTPFELAQRAVNRMDLSPVTVAISPPAGPRSAALVGLPVRLAAADSRPNIIGTMTMSAGDGARIVTATARMTASRWRMGDGTTVTCSGQDLRDAASAGCTHRYAQPSGGEADGVYRVRVDTAWHVDWAGAGQSGTMDITLSGPAREVTVVEARARIIERR